MFAGDHSRAIFANARFRDMTTTVLDGARRRHVIHRTSRHAARISSGTRFVFGFIGVGTLLAHPGYIDGGGISPSVPTHFPHIRDRNVNLRVDHRRIGLCDSREVGVAFDLVL